MKRVEEQVWYRRLLVLIRKSGWNLRVTPKGQWVLSRGGGGLIMQSPPQTRKGCYALAREMKAQERRSNTKEKRKKNAPTRRHGVSRHLRVLRVQQSWSDHSVDPTADTVEHHLDNSVVSCHN